jgi:TolB-like protein/Tfp pilus assembly protein PilF
VSESSKAVFLSYAREDSGAARRIAEALRASGLEVWFDENELRGGDAWDAKIRRQIRECALFLPVISATTQGRPEGYFRREWKLAVERSGDMAAGIAFIVPVVVDETRESDAVVPEDFMRVQWTRLPGALPTPQFVEHVRRLLATPRSGAAVGGRAATPTPAASPAKKTFSAALAVSLVAVAVAVGVVFFVTSRRPAPAASGDKSGTPVPGKPEVKPAAVSDKSIAVLPFANMSDDKDNAFFTDGVHEDILTNLALIREFRVVSRTSVLPYRATNKSVKQIAQELGVTYILEGSVRRAGNKVRVTGQLIHAATDEHVWAATYDRDLTDIFTIQTELSRQIAGALKAALSPQEQVFIARTPTTNPFAYDRLLQAREISNREGNTFAARQRRTALLREAVAMDPSFATAWAELAAVLAFGPFLGDADMEVGLAQAKEAIERAVQLAPDDPDVIANLGTYHYYAHRDYTRAAEQYDRLARLQPNSARLFSALGLIQRRQGRWADSLVHLRRAADLDPANIGYQRNLAASLYAARRWDEVKAVQRRICALLPGDLREGYRLAELHFEATASRRETEEFFAGLTPEQRESEAGRKLRLNWAVAIGDYAEAIRLDRLQPYDEQSGQPRWEQAYHRAWSYHALGDHAGARARLGDYPAELRQRSQREPNNFRLAIYLAAMEMLLGNREAALQGVDRAAALMPLSRDALDGTTYVAFRALVHDIFGDREMALAEYQRLLGIPSTSGILNVHTFRAGYIGTLKGDPRFEALFNDPKNNAPLF